MLVYQKKNFLDIGSNIIIDDKDNKINLLVNLPEGMGTKLLYS